MNLEDSVQVGFRSAPIISVLGAKPYDKIFVFVNFYVALTWQVEIICLILSVFYSPPFVLFFFFFR